MLPQDKQKSLEQSFRSSLSRFRKQAVKQAVNMTLKKPKGSVSTERESDIQKAIIDYLRLKKVFCWKQSNIGIYKHSTGSYIPSGMKGVPDILACIDGKMIGIEVKTKKGIQSPHQKKFQERLESAGGVYILARSVDDIMKII